VRLDSMDLSFPASLIVESGFTVFLLTVVLLLMPLNLMFEVLKWKTVTRPLCDLSLRKAGEGVLAGITAGLLLPNRVGEFAGKALSLSLSDFWKGSVLAVFTSMTQLLMTLVFGFMAIGYFGPRLNTYFGINVSIVPITIAITGIILLLFIFFNIHSVAVLFRKWKKIHNVISVIETAGFKVKLIVLALSFLRYLVFTSQNLLLLLLFEIPIPLMDAFFLISLLYFILSAIPTFVLTDLPVRGSVMLVLFLAWFDVSGTVVPYALEAKIVFASFLIWFVNLILPSLPGLYFLNKLSILRKGKT